MLENYFKIAWRNLKANKVFSFINILGLGLGIACSLLIYLWVNDELKYDGFHKHGKQLYKVIIHQKEKDGTISNSMDATPGRLAEVMKSEMPEVVNASIVLWDNDMLFETEGKTGNEKGRFVGPDFFKLFSFPLLQGDPETVLSAPDEIVISRKLAENYFGKESPIGKSIRIDGKRNFRVSGVVENVPDNSSIKFDFVLPVKYCFDDFPWLVAGWGFFGPPTYVMLSPNASAEKVNEKIRNFLKQHDEKVDDKLMSLQPFEDMYLYSRFTNGVPDGGRIEYVRLFTIIALFILLIACANFMNLATARSAKRAKEVGIRKVVGAGKGLLFGQFIIEAILTTFLAVLIAIVLLLLLLPVFNTLTEKQLSLHLGNPLVILSMLALILVTGFIAGSYPALYLSSMSPVVVFKGPGKSSIFGILFRKGLVIFQFTLSTMLIIATIIVYQQMHYIQTKNLGLNRDNVVYVPLDGELAKNYEPFINNILQTGAVESMSKASAIPTDVGMHTEAVSWAGKDPTRKVGFWDMEVDYGFTKTMKMNLQEGRDYDPSFGEDSTNFLINEQAAKVMGLKKPVGEMVSYENKQGRIIGVVKDFHIQSLHDPIEPLFVRFMSKRSFKILLIRIKEGKTQNILASMERSWKELNPKHPFKYDFADDLFKKQYLSEMMVEKLARNFAILAIFISCLGLFGLAMYMAEQRTREIGVRKVLGASSASIVLMLSKYFVKLVLIAAVIAFPLAWWAMNSWLRDFTYRISINWWVFVAAALLVLLIAFLTISFQALKAAMANPVKSLRVE